MQEAMLGLVKPPRKPVNLAMNSGSSRHAWESWKDIDEFYDEFWCRKSLSMLPNAIWMNPCHNLHDGWCGGHWSRAHHSRGAGQPTHRPGGRSISQSFDREAMNVRSINSIRGPGFTPSACHWPTMHHVLTRAGHCHGSSWVFPFFLGAWESVRAFLWRQPTLRHFCSPCCSTYCCPSLAGSYGSWRSQRQCWMWQVKHCETVGCWNMLEPSASPLDPLDSLLTSTILWDPGCEEMIRFAEMQKKTPAPKVKELSEAVRRFGSVWMIRFASPVFTSQYLKGQGLIQKLDTWYKYIEWASARVPPTPLLGGWAEGGWSISDPVTSQILVWNLVPFDSAGSNLSVPWTLQPLQPCQLIVLRRRIGLSLIFPIQW